MIEAYEYIRPLCGCLDGKKIWAPSTRINALLCCNEDNTVSYAGRFNDCDGDNCKIKKCIKHKDAIYAFSSEGIHIWIKEYSADEIRDIFYDNLNNFVIRDVIKVDSDAWIFPTSFSYPLIKVNLDTLEMSEIIWGNDETKGKDIYNFTKINHDNNVAVFATRMENQIYICTINTESSIFSSQYVDGMKWVNCATKFKDKIYILGKMSNGEDAILIYNSSSLVLVDKLVLKKIDTLFDSQLLMYSDICIYSNKIICIPGYAKDVFYYDLDNAQENKLGCYPEYARSFKGSGALFGFSDIADNRLVLFPRESDKIIRINLDTMQSELCELTIENIELVKLLTNQTIVYETNNNMFNAWLKGIASEKR